MLRLFPAYVLAAALTGCGAAADLGPRALVVQGKYDWMTCEQIPVYITMQRAKEIELTETMSKSAQETSGQFVNAAVHLPALTETRGHLRELEQARLAKKCEAPK